MKAFLDTSVLVAAFLGDHPHHAPSLKLFTLWPKQQVSCAAHSLAEVYAVMTRLPVRPLIAPSQAILFLENILERVTVITLEVSDYQMAIKQAADAGIQGGQIYDALLLRCALKAKAEVLYTWNLAHFRPLSLKSHQIVQTP